MIHQCFFEASQQTRLFASPLYRGFGLYTQVNPDIASNCPELADPAVQRQLSEYAAMLHLWRNPTLDADSWIGFTSYRQLDKFPTVLHDRAALERHLTDADVLGWGFYSFVDMPSKRPLSLLEQGERCHPGMTSALCRLLMLDNQPLPPNYAVGCSGLYCNYWVMSRTQFEEYMDWSWPLLRHALLHSDSFARDTPRALAYLVERLFICWYGLKQKRVRNLGSMVLQGSGNPFCGIHLQTSCEETFAPPQGGLNQRSVQAQRQLLAVRTWTLLAQDGADCVVEFLEDGRLGGTGRADDRWLLRQAGHDIILDLVEVHEVFGSLAADADGTWQGRQTKPPHAPLRLIPSVPLATVT